MKRALLISAILCFCFSANAHKFYASINDIYYNPETKSLEIILKFFVDDFEEAIKEHYQQELYLATEQENSNSDSLLQLYLHQSFIVWNGEKELPYLLIGHEADKDYVWIYLEVKSFKKDKGLKVKNSLLTEIFEEQSNQVNFDFEGLISTKYCLKNKPIVHF